MVKPSNWASVQANDGDFKRLTAGGYICKVIGARETTSKAGNEMLVLALDIAEGDFKNYFKETYERRKERNPEAKWPCSYYQLTGNDSGDAGRQSRFKGMVANFEKSNGNFKFNFNPDDFKGMMIGVVFREEEYQGNDGNVHSNVRPYSLRRIAGIEDIPAPAPKKLEIELLTPTGDFATPVAQEEIPF